MPTASSDAVCKRTIKRRSIEIEEHRSMISKGFLDLQLQSELRLVSKVERQKLMESINSIEVDADYCLAIKAREDNFSNTKAITV